MFLIELKRAFSRRSFKIAVFIGIVFCVLSLVETGGRGGNLLQTYLKANVTTPFDNFIFLNLNEVSNILILILPIISSIGYSDSYLEDVNSGFVKFIYTRHKKQKYLVSKFLANFIAGGVSFAAPLLLNFIALILMYPSMQPNSALGRSTIMYGGLFPQLFYDHPAFYILMWIAIYFSYAGAFASMGLTLGIFIKNKFVTLILPFILCNAFGILLELCNKMKYSPIQFLYLSNSQSFAVMVSEFVIIFSASIVIFCFGGCKNETC